MIASIRTHAEPIGTERQSQRILKNIARHMELIPNASRQGESRAIGCRGF